MQAKLIAKKNFETMNIWQEPVSIAKGEVFNCEVTELPNGSELATIELLKQKTIFDMEIVKQFFYVEYLGIN